MRYFKAVLVLLALSVFLGSPAYSKSSGDSKGYKTCDKKHSLGGGDGYKMYGHKGDGQRGHQEMMSKLFSSLDLSDDQLADIKKFRLEYRKKTIRMQADLEVAGLELKEILIAEEVDLSAAERKIAEVAALKAKLKFYRIKMLEELKRDKLNDKQRKKFREIMGSKMHKAFGGGRY